MVFFNHVLYANIGIPKAQISRSFTVFLKEYIKNMIEYYVLMELDALLLPVRPLLNFQGSDFLALKDDQNIVCLIICFSFRSRR